jgi:hypothetical protein
MVLSSGILFLSACGVEVAATAAVAGELKAEEAEIAQREMEKTQERLREIQALTAQRDAALESLVQPPPPSAEE